MYDPYISRIIVKRRALGINFTFRWTMRASHWRKFTWPIPLNFEAGDSE